MLTVLELNNINLNFDSWHNCRGFQHYWPRLSFQLIGSCYPTTTGTKISQYHFPL